MSEAVDLLEDAVQQKPEDDRLKLLSFTGSPGVGWDLKARAGKKPVILELGGNAACIVDADANLDDAAGRGGLNPAKKWWWDIELEEDGAYRPRGRVPAARAPAGT